MKEIYKKVVIFILLITLIYTVIAYAYTEGVSGSISLNGDDIVFNQSVSTSLNASDLNRIELYHEEIGRGEILFRYGSLDNNLKYVLHKMMDKQRINKKNKDAVEYFNIDLNSYTEISRDNPKFKEDLLFLLCPQVEATRGDSVPTIFLDQTQNSGIILKQDKGGLKYKYSFVKQDGRWMVIDKMISQ